MSSSRFIEWFTWFTRYNRYGVTVTIKAWLQGGNICLRCNPPYVLESMYWRSAAHFPIVFCDSWWLYYFSRSVFITWLSVEDKCVGVKVISANSSVRTSFIASIKESLIQIVSKLTFFFLNFYMKNTLYIMSFPVNKIWSQNSSIKYFVSPTVPQTSQ